MTGIDDDKDGIDLVFGTKETSVRPPEPSHQNNDTVAQGPVEDTQANAIPDATQRVGTPHNVPDKIGKYVVLDRLGAGGMAEVFLAKQEGPAGFSKTVVIKRSFPHLVENQRYVDMFMREAKIAARLNHPNVVQIYDFGEDEGLYFIAMEFVDGVTLHRLAKRAWRVGRSLPMEIVVRAMADAATGLNHAHNLRGTGGKLVTLVHRDISPDNLMINREGVTKVLDFGIAKASDTQSVTRSGEIKGKIPFMSPEQVKGFDVDGRSDLYSLGICFYWMLTGKRPFQGSSDFVTMQAVVEEEAEKPSHFNPSVPAEIDEVVLKMIAKDPDERFQSGQELADKLGQLIEGARGSSQTFVNELMAEPASAGEATEHPITVSEGFLPATPISSRLSQSMELELQKPSMRVPVAAAGGLALVVGLVLAAVFLIGGDDEIDPPSIPARQPIVVTPPDPDPVTPPVIADPVTPDPDPLTPDPVTDDPVIPDPVTDPDKPDPVVEKPKPKPKPKARTQRIALKGPSYVRFQIGGRWVRAGSASVSTRARSVRARDTRYGMTTSLSIKNSAVDWGSLATGSLQFRVYPWAEVTVGSKKLGKTPLPKLTVAAGTYKVTLKYDDQVQTKTIKVGAGGATVKARF